MSIILCSMHFCGKDSSRIQDGFVRNGQLKIYTKFQSQLVTCKKKFSMASNSLTESEKTLREFTTDLVYLILPSYFQNHCLLDQRRESSEGIK